jgi:hypothetical protein
MTGSALVVADTTPLSYFTIIGQVHVLLSIEEGCVPRFLE